MKYITYIILSLNLIFSQEMLIPMDNTQSNHLKSYGLVYWILEQEINVEWLLNYKGGAFLLNAKNSINNEATIRGISYNIIDASTLNEIYATIENNNMDIVLLEKIPKIAVYSHKDKQPWDDAVTLALTYAEIDYDTVFDSEVLA